MKTLICFFLLLSSVAFASPSAYRDPRLPAESYYPDHHQATAHGGSAFGSKEALSKLDLSLVPLAPSTAFVEAEFISIRDERFLRSEDNADFLRRLTWLFPDDGCFARAEMSVRLIDKQRVVKPAKVFIFGNLRVRTPNAPSGEATWWYHVAIAYRTADGVFILDPAVDPKKPLLLDAWVGLVSGSSKEPKLSLCAAETFEPDSDCRTPDPISPTVALRQAERFLPAEWDRLLELDRDPGRELGEFPPWLQP